GREPLGDEPVAREQQGLGADENTEAGPAIGAHRRSQRIRARSIAKRLTGWPSTSRTTRTGCEVPVRSLVGNQYTHLARKRPLSCRMAVRSFCTSAGSISRSSTSRRGEKWRANCSLGPTRETHNLKRSFSSTRSFSWAWGFSGSVFEDAFPAPGGRRWTG